MTFLGSRIPTTKPSLFAKSQHPGLRVDPKYTGKHGNSPKNYLCVWMFRWKLGIISPQVIHHFYIYIGKTSHLHSGKLIIRMEDVWILLKMGIFQPAM